MRPSIWLLIIAVLGGCRAPIPSFKPFSNTRVPPPQTGEVGAGDLYYNQGAPAQPPTTGRKQGNSGTSTSLSTDLDTNEDDGDDLAWTAPRRSRNLANTDRDDVRFGATIRGNRDRGTTVGYDEEADDDSNVRTAEYESPGDRYQPGSTGSDSRVGIEAMPVNDATGNSTWKSR